MITKPTKTQKTPAAKPRTIEELDLQFKTDMADIARMHKASEAERKSEHKKAMARLDKEHARLDKELVRLDKGSAERESAHEEEMARLDKKSAEREAAHEEEMARLDKKSAERKAAHEEEMARLDKELARLDREYVAAKEERLKAEARLKEVEKEIGAFNDGTVLEEDIFHALLESRTICGIRLDSVLYDMKAGSDGQFDVVGFNGKYVVVIEVKRTLKTEDAARFAKKQKPVFERTFASIIGKKEVLGAMVYRRANKKAKAAALDNGLLLIQSVGKKKLHQITSAT